MPVQHDTPAELARDCSATAYAIDDVRASNADRLLLVVGPDGGAALAFTPEQVCEASWSHL